MRRKLLATAAAAVLATGAVTGCDDAGSPTGAGGPGPGAGAGSGEARVGVILPDTKSSQRWRTDDPKFLKAAFDAAGVPVEIRNAEGDRAAFLRIGDEMIDSGVKVLMIANLDPATGKAVLDRARARKIPTVDYDRLTVGGGANYYVSFDNRRVGELQAYGLSECLADAGVRNPVVAELNGSPTDNNATLFKAGATAVLQPRYDNAEYTKGPDQSVPDWDNDEAGRIFAQMLEQQPRIGAVLAANDGLAGAVIKVLRKHGRNGKVPVTGQDATVEGLRNILAGDQCMTIYKRIKPEAETAAGIAAELFHGRTPAVSDQIKDPETGGYVRFASLPPEAIDITTVRKVVADGFVTRKQLCTGRYAELCDRYGVTEADGPR